MAIEENAEEIQQIAAERKEALHWRAIDKEKDRQLQIDLKKLDIDGNVEMKKLELAAANARLKATTRTDVWRRVLVGAIKLPVLPLAIIFAFVLELLHRDSLESLDEFVSL